MKYNRFHLEESLQQEKKANWAALLGRMQWLGFFGKCISSSLLLTIVTVTIIMMMVMMMKWHRCQIVGCRLRDWLQFEQTTRNSGRSFNCADDVDDADNNLDDLFGIHNHCARPRRAANNVIIGNAWSSGIFPPHECPSSYMMMKRWTRIEVIPNPTKVHKLTLVEGSPAGSFFNWLTNNNSDQFQLMWPMRPFTLLAPAYLSVSKNQGGILCPPPP